MRSRLSATLLIGAISALAACSSVLTRHPVAVASANLTDSAGKTVATASLWQEASGLVHVEVEALSLIPGAHGLHFHAIGRCDPTPLPVFSSAGAHFNPLGRQHGLNNPAGPHAGDAPNVSVAANGTGKASFTTDRVTLGAGGTSLMDADGSALVIHAAADDQVSQPSGNSGARIACGVIKTIP